tara:strand:- start:311 stop:727 length:417 start_codon:yes stop_codon:yes gene_type:complete
MSKRKLTKRQQQFLKYTIGVVLYPLAFIIAPIYKKYRKVRYNKDTQIKYKDIVDGFSYLVIRDSAVEAMAKRRAEHCGSCMYAKYSGKLNTVMVGGETRQIKGMYCDLCGCTLAGKVRAEGDSCPAKKWGPEKIDTQS